jgi:alanine racemase
MDSPTHRSTCAVINLGAVHHNISRMRAICGKPIMALVKANAYGHGAEAVAKTAVQAGCNWFGVAAAGEGVALRKAGLEGRILVLGYTPPDLAGEAIEHGLSLTVYDLELAKEYARTARLLGQTAGLHVKIETGMGRLGLPPIEAAELVRAIHHLRGVAPEGMYTQFATADEADLTFTRQQLKRFTELVDLLQAEGKRPEVVHAANSAAGLRLPEARFDLIRVGIAMYGLHPSKQAPLPEDFIPAMTWKTIVTQVKWMEPGASISYGRTYITQGREQIAVLPVGYADGFRRSPPHNPSVLIHGSRVPVVGRVCMDHTMINVSQVDHVNMDDEVVIIGQQGEETIRAEEVAEWWGTISYEVVSGILARVPRVYADS